MKFADFANLVRETLNPDFLVSASGGKIVHVEVGYSFEILATAPHIAFSLDVPGRNPFAILNSGTSGVTARNDLTIIARVGDDNNWKPAAFVIEIKDSTKPAGQKQIEAGFAFCGYLEALLQAQEPAAPRLATFGVLVYKLPRPPLGTTGLAKPKFDHVGRLGLRRTQWQLATPLPLSALVGAVT